MKIVNSLILLVIGASVAYLAYSEYEKRQMLSEVAEVVADPKVYAVKTWAKRAKLDCDLFTEVQVRESVGAGLIPMKFTCRASTGFWTIENRECTDAEKQYSPTSEKVSIGRPARDGQLYKPAYLMCWITKRKE